MKLTALFKEFFDSEKAGGLILMACTLLSLLLANSFLREPWQHLLHYPVAGHGLLHWINDGLMTIFFLLIGLELEREVYIGELSNMKSALLPISGALGGMVVPAALYLAFNWGTPTQPGAGIPMATDIAFALGVLSLLGDRVPVSLKVFLTALAVIDDLGAILIIAIFYSQTLDWANLLTALGIFGGLLALNRLKVHRLWPYYLGGLAMWYFMLHSGVHATITGVLLAFSIPFGNGDDRSPSYALQHHLHRPVAFVILPLFALANTAIVIGAGWQNDLLQPFAIGILSGLILGKPLGISVVCWLAVRAGICKLPDDLTWKHLIATGMLAGIGFTMSIFITLLAFDDPATINSAKLMILIASFTAGITGFFGLKKVLSTS